MWARMGVAYTAQKSRRVSQQKLACYCEWSQYRPINPRVRYSLDRTRTLRPWSCCPCCIGRCSCWNTWGDFNISTTKPVNIILVTFSAALPRTLPTTMRAAVVWGRLRPTAATSGVPTPSSSRETSAVARAPRSSTSPTEQVRKMFKKLC